MELSEKQINKIHTNLQKGYFRTEKLSISLKNHLSKCKALYKSRSTFYNTMFFMRVNKPMSLLPIIKIESVMIVYIFDYAFGVGKMLEVPLEIYNKYIDKFIFVKNERDKSKRYIINQWRDLSEYDDYLRCYKPISVQIKETETKLQELKQILSRTQYNFEEETQRLESLKKILKK